MGSIAERLKQFRTEIGKTQREVAEQSGVSARGYQGYEDGRSIPGGEAIAGLVGLGLNANWLLTGEGPMLLADLAAPVAIPAAPAIAYSHAPAPAAPAVLHEARPPVPATQPAPTGPVFDPMLLQQVVDFFYRWQIENKDRVRIGQKAHGAVIAVLYKVAASSGKVVKEDLEQVMSIAA